MKFVFKTVLLLLERFVTIAYLFLRHGNSVSVSYLAEKVNAINTN